MGIPSYFVHIIKKHNKILKILKILNNNTSINVDNLYLDCNSLIYDAAYELSKNNEKIKNKKNDKNNDMKIINIVYNKLVYYINLLKPTQKIYIAFDGVAPVAKLSQQRNRRYKSWFQNKFLEENNNTNNSNNSNQKWYTIVVTPGTEFMNKLGKTIIEKFKEPHKFNVNEIIISTSDTCGEGEHKIYQYIRDNSVYHKDTKTIIYGLDADLIMLTLNHLHISPSMYLFRDTPHYIKNLDNTLDPNHNYLLDIPLFSKILSLDLNNDIQPSTEQEQNKIFDYIFLCFFLGNDFLPHFPALNIRTNGINHLMNSYVNILGNKNINILDNSNNKLIIWRNLRKLIQFLSDNELNFLKEEYKLRSKLSKNVYNRSGELEEDLMMIPIKNREVEIYINPFEIGWEKRYYKELFDITIDENNKKQICMNYLEGLEWTIKYYSGDCIDWRWKYNYDYPPLLSDLINYIPIFDKSFIKTKELNPVSPYVQLSYVLPKPYLNLLPKQIHNSLLKNYDSWYNNNYDFKWAFCRYFWECHAVMPNINIELLEKHINSLK